MKKGKRKLVWRSLSLTIAVICSILAATLAAPRATTAPASVRTNNSPNSADTLGRVIVVPKFGGEILGYDIDRNGNEGLLSEAVALSGGANLVATETFDQRTGAILKVVVKEKRTTQDDYVTAGIFGHIGLDLFQHAGQNHFLTVDPLSGGKFSGKWSPPIKKGYQLWTISVGQDTPDVAAYQSSFDTGLTYVFSSNVAKNTFGRQISLKSIINVNEFFHPAIALDTKTNQAVLADSQGCSENCISSIALVNLVSGKIVKFTAGLGNGTVNGLAVDSRNGIACTTTLSDSGVEFYDLRKQTGFEVQIPDGGTPLDAGLDVEFDPIHQVFLVAQYSSTGDPHNPQPRIYVFDESGTVIKAISSLERIPVSPSLIALNPQKRVGMVPVIVEPQHQALELQSFKY